MDPSDELRDPMPYDVMREVLNLYQGRCLALARRAPTADQKQAWRARREAAADRVEEVDPASRRAVAAMTAHLRAGYADLPDPGAVSRAS